MRKGEKLILANFNKSHTLIKAGICHRFDSGGLTRTRITAEKHILCVPALSECKSVIHNLLSFCLIADKAFGGDIVGSLNGNDLILFHSEHTCRGKNAVAVAVNMAESFFVHCRKIHFFVFKQRDISLIVRIFKKAFCCQSRKGRKYIKLLFCISLK